MHGKKIEVEGPSRKKFKIESDNVSGDSDSYSTPKSEKTFKMEEDEHRIETPHVFKQSSGVLDKFPVKLGTTGKTFDEINESSDSDDVKYDKKLIG